MTDVSEALTADESVRERLALRTGGTVVVTDDRLLVADSDSTVSDDPAASNAGASDDSDGVTAVDLDDVAEVTIEEFDWFLGVLSTLLVGYGLYSTGRNVALGLAFAAFGAVSLYWTYRKRGKVRIRVLNRPKPISVFPADAGAFYDALEPVMAAESGGSSEDESS